MKKIEPPTDKVEVTLSDCDGNAMSIIARCTKAMRRAGTDDETVAAFAKEAMSGDYDHVLQTCMKWCDVS